MFGLGVALQVADIFNENLNPYIQVPIPEGLDLESWINEPPPPDLDDGIVQNGIFDHNEIKRIVAGNKGLSGGFR